MGITPPSEIPMKPETPLQELRGIGPASISMLEALEIRSIEQVIDLGPVFVFVAVRNRFPRVSKNLLWALAAGLEDRHWTTLTAAEKAALEVQMRELAGH